MLITFSHRIVTIVAAAAIAIGAQFLGAPTGPGTHAAALQHPQNTAGQAATVHYWTPARMDSALQSAQSAATPTTLTTMERNLVRRLMLRSPNQPTSKPVAENSSKPAHSTLASQKWRDGNTAGEGLQWTHDGAVSDATGKIFFTLDGANYVCSGTLVGGRETDTVLTAAHCVTGGLKADGTGSANTMDWATNWLFVPGYHDGQMPYGEYTAQKFFVAKGWTGPSAGTEENDVAFVRIAADTSSTPTPPPGLPINFAGAQDTLPASNAYVFGYPSLAPYSGMYQNYCAGAVGAASGSMRTTCRMTAGDSGGPWLAGFSPTSGTGTVVAVTTYKLSNNLSVLYGAVLGPTAHALYAQAAGLSADPAPLG